MLTLWPFLPLALGAATPTPALTPDPSLGAATPAIAIAAIGTRPPGPDREAIEAAHALRAALRDRGARVLGQAEGRAALGSETRLTELERAYAGAQAAYQADEVESALRLLESVLAELDRLPESEAAYDLRVRAHLRVAVAERARGRADDARVAMRRILALEPAFVVDPDQFAPAFRREFEEERRRTQQIARQRVRIESNGGPVRAYVDGKAVGSAPLTVELPPGRYRVGGSVLSGAESGAPRVPPVWIEVVERTAEVVLDARLAATVRVEAGPGLAVASNDRGAGAVALGAWLGAGQIVALEQVEEAGARAIDASLYDVGAERLVRTAQVPLVRGAVHPDSAAALASFLLTGRRSVVTVELSPTDVPSASRRASWLRPAAYAAGIAALAAGTFAVLQARSSHDGYAAAAAMVRSDGALVAGVDRARYDATVGGAESSGRSAYVAGAGAAALAIAAGVLGYFSFDARGPLLGPAIRF